MRIGLSTPSSMFAGAGAALGASACCAGPLLLVVLGISGAWTSRLAALESLQPYFAAAALGFFALAFRRLYVKTGDCADGQDCAVPATRRRQRIVFWVVAIVAVTTMALPLYAPLFY